MKLQFAHVARLAIMLGMLANTVVAGAQNTPALPGASAPSTTDALPHRGPVNRTRPTNAQQSMDAATGLPEGRITPQIRIPLGAKPAPQPLELPGRKPAAAASNTPSGDAAARCEAQRGEQVRAKCRDRLARESK